jgi:hypothetical protein
VIKSSRYLLLANPENLDESGLERLRALREANESFSTAYQLSELIHTFQSVTRTDSFFA